MVESILLPAGLGIVWGFLVSVFNHFCTSRALKNPNKSFVSVFFVFRQAILFLAMLVVFQNVPMLIGTALGLLAVKNYIFVRTLNTLFREKKGVK